MNRYECMKRLAAKLKGDELFVISLGKMVDEWENAYPTVRTLNMGALGVECGTAIGSATIPMGASFWTSAALPYSATDARKT